MEAPPTKDALPNKEGPEVDPNRPEVKGNNTRFKSIKGKQFESTYATGNELFHPKDKLTRRLSEWRKITSDSEVVNTVCGEKIEFNSLPLQNRQCKENRISESENGVIAQEIRKLLDKDVIAKSSYEKDEYISVPIFLRPKPDGSHRLILNLKSLNQHVVYRV